MTNEKLIKELESIKDAVNMLGHDWLSASSPIELKKAVKGLKRFERIMNVISREIDKLEKETRGRGIPRMRNIPPPPPPQEPKIKNHERKHL